MTQGDGTFGKDLDSTSYWNQEAKRYADHVGASRKVYHDARFDIAYAQLDAANLGKGARVHDFGCGDGTSLVDLAAKGYRVDGSDIAEEMIALAKVNTAKANVTPGRLFVGGAHELAQYGEGELDAIIALHVLIYLTDEEEAAFYKHARRALRPGGALVIAHSNELFDMYALNRGTVEFFGRNFVAAGDVERVGTLVKDGTQPRKHVSYNVRENPLAYPAKLASLGFEETDAQFFNLHPTPPPLLPPGSDAGRIWDLATIRALPKWKQMFMCSSYFSLSLRK